MSTRTHLEELADRMQMDLRNANNRLVEIRAHIAQLDLDDEPPLTVCPDCRVRVSGTRRLAEHRYQLHDAPEPDHWKETAA